MRDIQPAGAQLRVRLRSSHNTFTRAQCAASAGCGCSAGKGFQYAQKSVSLRMGSGCAPMLYIPQHRHAPAEDVEEHTRARQVAGAAGIIPAVRDQRPGARAWGIME